MVETVLIVRGSSSSAGATRSSSFSPSAAPPCFPSLQQSEAKLLHPLKDLEDDGYKVEEVRLGRGIGVWHSLGAV